MSTRYGITYEDSLCTDSENKRLYRYRGCLCGVLVESRQDQMVPLIGKEGNQVILDHGPAINEKGEDRELAQNHLYFAIHENHIAYVCSQPGADSRLEDFLSWLLIMKTEILDNESSILLEKIPEPNALNQIIHSDVEKIIISTGNSDMPNNENSIFYRFSSILFGKNKTNSPVQTPEDLKGIGAKLELTCRKRTVQETKRTIIQLATMLYEEDLRFLTLYLKDENGQRKVLKGDELSLKAKVEVEGIDPVEIAPTIMNQLARWLTSRLADCTLT